MSNEEVIVNDTEEKGEVKKSEMTLETIGVVAVKGAVAQLADKSLYQLGLAAYLLFGKDTALKAMGAIVSVGAIYNAAKYVNGEMGSKEKTESN